MGNCSSGRDEDFKVLISSGEDSLIKFWDIHTRKEIRTIKEHTRNITSMLVMDTQLIDGTWDSTISSRNIKDDGNNKIRIFKGIEGSACSLIKFDTNIIACGSGDAKISFWDLTKDQQEPFETYQTDHSHYIKSVIKIGDKKLVTGGDDNKILVWDISDKKQSIEQLGEHDDHVNGLVLLDPSRIASCSRDKTIKIWQIAPILSDKEKKQQEASANSTPGTFTPVLMKTLKGHTDSINAIVRLDEKRIVTSSDDKTVRIWDTVTGNEIRKLIGHEAAVNTLVKVNDNTVASGSRDGVLKLWEISNGKAVWSEKAHEKGVSSLTAY